MKRIFLLGLVALLSIMTVNAQRKIEIGKGDTLLVKDPGSITVPVKRPARKNIPIALPIPDQRPIIMNMPPQPVVAKTDQFSTPMVILFSLMGAFALTGFILGLIAFTRQRNTYPAQVHIINHGSHGYGGKSQSNPNLSMNRDESTNKSFNETSNYGSSKKEEKHEPATASENEKN